MSIDEGNHLPIIIIKRIHSPTNNFIDNIDAEQLQQNSNLNLSSSPNKEGDFDQNGKSSDTSFVQPLPDSPIQLIRPDPLEHQKLEIIEANIKYLHQITSAVAVIAVVGKFHSGKSFLLNQLMGKQNGFGIGPSVNPQTMGIWMWGKVCSV